MTDINWDPDKDARTAALWRDVVLEKVKAPLLDEDLAMVELLTLLTLQRWRQLAESEADPALAFRSLYLENKTRAQGAIVAVVELMKAVADAKPLPDQFKEMMI